MERSKIFRLTLLFIISALLQSCARVTANVESFADYGAYDTGKTFYITNNNPGLPADDIEYRLYAGYLTNALESTGYKQVNKEDAALQIKFNFGMENHGISETYTLNDRVYTDILFNSFINIEALDHEDKQVWKIRVNSYSKNNKLADMIPYLILAARPYTGENRQITIRLKKSDTRLSEITGI